MIPSTLTLSVDEANNATMVDNDYSLFLSETHKKVFTHDDDNSVAERHNIAFARRLPTRSGNFYGTEKCSLKLTDDQSVATVDGGTTIAPAIMELSTSFPVGTTTAAKVKQLQTMMALLDLAIVEEMMDTQSI